MVVDKRKQRGGDHRSEHAKSKPSSDGIETSAAATAELVGTSPRKVEKVRSIFDYAEASSEHGKDERIKADDPRLA
jgi:hypothetical protein